MNVFLDIDHSKVGKKLLYNCNNWDLGDEDFDDLCYDINLILSKKNPNGYWKAYVKSFGWQCLDGHMYVHTINAADLIRKILPNTECTFHVYNYGKGIAIQNYHHDSCTGNEWYYLVPITEKNYNKNK